MALSGGKHVLRRSAALISALCVLVLTAAPVTSTAAAGAMGAMRSDHVQQWLDRATLEPALRSAPVTVILETDADATLPARVSTHGGALRYRSGRLHEISIPAGRLAALLAGLPGTALARLPYPHEALLVTGQGVALTGASDMQTLGQNGAGIKIGIIDLGFASLSTSQSRGELPASLSIVDYTGTGTGGTDHGTNVAEIVHEMAPGASLYLAKVSTEVQLSQAMSDMAAAGVKVINHSVAWFGAAFYDGTGPICDVANGAYTAGMQWVNAMGNSRYGHYLGTFTDANADLRHEFASGQNYNTMSVTAGSPVTLILNWNAYPQTTVDYNLYLYNGNPDAGGTLVASSANKQSGKSGQWYPTPYEQIDYTPGTSGTYYIVVKKVTASTTNLPLTLFSSGADLVTRTTASSIVQPADCANVLSVGATDLSDGVEYFSSEGPTTDGRPKPEVSGPDRVKTSLSGLFAGTSASSPHVTAAVALLMAQNPGSSLTQIKSLLTGTARDVHTIGYDYRTGYGRISLDADADGYNHDRDNCRLVANPTQADMDGDGIGDACDDDIDGDGLTNVQEAALGTDPARPDTDGDGLTDSAEVNTQGTNPLLADTDSDTLTDGAEVTTYLTNPLLADTDGDGLTDSAEVDTYHTNPLLADSDGDGLSDGAEANTHSTNPLLSDTDSDGLSDGAEVNTYSTNPLQVDTDADGLTDGQEVNVYGTSPTSSNIGDLAPRTALDGQINVADLMMLVRFVEGLDVPDNRDIILGDINRDGVLDIRDVLLLRRSLTY